MHVTIFGTKVFVVVTILWIILVGSKCHVTHPHKREAEGNFTHTHTHTHTHTVKRNLKLTALKIRMMWSQTKGC